MTQFYVEWEEIRRWYGHIEANTLEEASKKAGQFKREELDQKFLGLTTPPHNCVAVEDTEGNI